MLRSSQYWGLYWSILKDAFPARRGPYFWRILLTLIGVPSGYDNRYPGWF